VPLSVGELGPHLTQCDIVASHSSCTAALILDEFTDGRATDSHMLRRQEHRHSQSSSMERSTGWTHWLQSVTVSF